MKCSNIESPVRDSFKASESAKLTDHSGHIWLAGMDRTRQNERIREGTVHKSFTIYKGI